MPTTRRHLASLARVLLPCAIVLLTSAIGRADVLTADVVVYGGTAGGVMAAVQVARMGHTVMLVEPTMHVGGMTSGGLGATDIGNKAAIGGLSREFYRRIAKHYSDDHAWTWQERGSYRSPRQAADEDTMWTFEPHVAEQVLRAFLDEAKVDVLFGQRLDLRGGAARVGGRIDTIRMESGLELRAKMYIDASYEGDLIAVAGVTCHVGREASDKYDESLNGVQLGSKKHQFMKPVDPYVVPGDPTSGLVWGLHDSSPGEQGQGDRRVQAYNFRMCMTDVPENKVAWPRPREYSPEHYELLLRYIQAGVWDALNSITPLPNHKTDTNNNGAFSTDFIGGSYGYPTGDYAMREKIVQDHVNYQQGMMYFLANDPRVPEAIREEISRWGLCRDEFTDNGFWPNQIYVREARRMVGEYVMTQHNCQGKEVVDDGIALAAYTMDSHNVQRYVLDGKAANEGDVQVGGFPPYPISYRALVPRAKECENLLAPVCLSASHIAYGSIRMEPVFMVLGQSAATAACQAIDDAVPVQKLDVAKLRARLLADGQVLEWKTPPQIAARKASSPPRAKLEGLVLDDKQAMRIGSWSESQAISGFIGDGYLHDDADPRHGKRLVFRLQAPSAGTFELRLAYTPHANRASNVQVIVGIMEDDRKFSIDERRAPAIDKLFEPVTKLDLRADQLVVVTVTDEKADGYVVVDAIQLVPVKSEPAKEDPPADDKAPQSEKAPPGDKSKAK